jgi:hypothetical protein
LPAHPRSLGQHLPTFNPEQVGTAIVDIVTGPADDRDAYPLTATGHSPVQ